jgi:hypothetical protein
MIFLLIRTNSRAQSATDVAGRTRYHSFKWLVSVSPRHTHGGGERKGKNRIGVTQT